MRARRTLLRAIFVGTAMFASGEIILFSVGATTLGAVLFAISAGLISWIASLI